LQDTADLAESLADNLVVGDVVVLSGDLGSGKTTFAKFVIKKLLRLTTELVTSPSFTIANVYKGESLEVWHADLYRLNNTDEVWNTGLIDDLDTRITIIEWGETVDKYLPNNRVALEFFFVDNEPSIRSVHITFDGDKWLNVLGPKAISRICY
jgi:tRNA threonylcarbamoyladenosine biosynthesis protein TsaE